MEKAACNLFFSPKMHNILAVVHQISIWCFSCSICRMVYDTNSVFNCVQSTHAAVPIVCARTRCGLCTRRACQGSEGAPHMEPTALRPCRRAPGPLAPPISYKRSGFSSSLGFRPVLSDSNKNVATLLPNVVSLFRLFNIWSNQVSWLQKLKKNKTKRNKAKTNGEGSKATRRGRNLCQDLWKVHPVQPSWYVNNTFLDRTWF